MKFAASFLVLSIFIVTSPVFAQTTIAGGVGPGLITAMASRTTDQTTTPQSWQWQLTQEVRKFQITGRCAQGSDTTPPTNLQFWLGGKAQWGPHRRFNATVQSCDAGIGYEILNGLLPQVMYSVIQFDQDWSSGLECCHADHTRSSDYRGVMIGLSFVPPISKNLFTMSINFAWSPWLTRCDEYTAEFFAPDTRHRRQAEGGDCTRAHGINAGMRMTYFTWGNLETFAEYQLLSLNTPDSDFLKGEVGPEHPDRINVHTITIAGIHVKF